MTMCTYRSDGLHSTRMGFVCRVIVALFHRDDKQSSTAYHKTMSAGTESWTVHDDKLRFDKPSSSASTTGP